MKYLLITILAFLQLQIIAQDKFGKKIKIQWVDNLPGDFSFAKKWSYPEGIDKNEFGQLVCDGLCPEGVYELMDSTGKINKNSLKDYYKIVDTTHQYHTLKADAWCYEYAGTDFIECTYQDNNRYKCYTLQNPGTHCSLIFSFNKDYYISYISLDGVSSAGTDWTIFPSTSGTIKIDKKKIRNGKLKAVFDFKFENKDDPSKPIYWKGKILTKIENVIEAQ